MPCEFFHDGPGNAKLPLRRLVRICGRADGDALTGTHMLEFLAQEPGAMLLDVNLAFKIQAVAQLHELVRVAGVAVLAGKLTSAIGIDHPAEGYPRRVAAGQQRSEERRVGKE